MADLLKTGAEFIESQRRSFMASEVVYGRGGLTVTLPATRAQTRANMVDTDGVQITSSIDDFIVTTSDLVLGGAAIKPKIGDTITDGTQNFEVISLSGEGTWRYSDAYRLSIRIHTKRA